VVLVVPVSERADVFREKDRCWIPGDCHPNLAVRPVAPGIERCAGLNVACFDKCKDLFLAYYRQTGSYGEDSSESGLPTNRKSGNTSALGQFRQEANV
jgi:hypothetical protein